MKSTTLETVGESYTLVNKNVGSFHDATLRYIRINIKTNNKRDSNIDDNKRVSILLSFYAFYKTK